MRDRLQQWWRAPEPEPPLSATAVLAHAGRGAAKLLPLFLVVVGWQYVSVGLPGAVLTVGGGVAVVTAFVAGVLGSLDYRYRAAVAFGVTLAVVGQLGPFVAEMGASDGYIQWAALVLLVVAGGSAVVGYAEVRRLQTTAVGE